MTKEQQLIERMKTALGKIVELLEGDASICQEDAEQAFIIARDMLKEVEVNHPEPFVPEVPDVPRDANNWPTVEPKFFTEAQLRREGEKWRPAAKDTSSGTVSFSCWNKYATELCSRGFIKEVDIRRNLLTGELD